MKHAEEKRKQRINALFLVPKAEGRKGESYMPKREEI